MNQILHLMLVALCVGVISFALVSDLKRSILFGFALLVLWMLSFMLK